MKDSTNRKMIQLHTMCFFLLCMTMQAIHIKTAAQALSGDTDTLLWKVSGFHNITKNEDVTSYSDFTSHQNKITWSQSGGDQINEFPVTSKEGVWPDVSQSGSVLFHVTWNGLNGTIQFAKEGGHTAITLEIYKEGANITPYLFSVSEVVKN